MARNRQMKHIVLLATERRKQNAVALQTAETVNRNGELAIEANTPQMYSLESDSQEKFSIDEGEIGELSEDEEEEEEVQIRVP